MSPTDQNSKDFTPRRSLRSPHAQTIAGWALPRRVVLPPAEDRLFGVAADAQVLCRCHWQPDAERHLTLIVVHGLEGSSESRYVIGTASKAWAAGMNVVRMNMRNCGGTEHLAATLYHSGMTEDIRRVLLDELAGREALTEIYLTGFSMSGNMVLRLAGDYGVDAPPALKGVAAVSPSIDLDSCAAALERRGNALYRWSFVKHLRARVRRKSRLRPGAYDPRTLRRVRTIREFDERITAPHGGYRDASDYYARTSSRAVIGHIRVPTLIVHAADDPLIPTEPFFDEAITGNPEVLLVLTRRGGHVGFLSDRAHAEDRHWAENRLVEFCTLLRGDGGR
jgi:uncharacterized protein